MRLGPASWNADLVRAETIQIRSAEQVFDLGFDERDFAFRQPDTQS